MCLVEYIETVMEVPVYSVQMSTPNGVSLRSFRSGRGHEIVASRPSGYRLKYSEWAWYSTNSSPAKKAALKVVVIACETPPPIWGSRLPKLIAPACL